VDLVDQLQADGLIVHINPFQEWLQPEGDRYFKSPVLTLTKLLDHVNFPVMVKEVGQGMGPQSMKALFELPLAAIDFAAGGGTNFALLELLRSDEKKREVYGPLAEVGHSAEEMVEMINPWYNADNMNKEFIISGGIQHFLDGYYLIQKCKFPAIYGQASAFLKHATGDYDELAEYVDLQAKGLALSKTFLKIKDVPR
jgi:isopentenyl-diphosphate delta-isomerase